MNALDFAYAFGAAALSPVWLRKRRSGWGERLGKVGDVPAPAAGRKRLVLHAVSVGEVNTLRELVPLLRREMDVVVCTTTDTGMDRAMRLFGPEGESPGAVVRYPLDFSRAVERFLDAVRPDAVGLVELEVWPNFLSACAGRGIPVGVINGRLSERSFGGYRKLRAILRKSFASLAFAAVQNEAYAARFRHMGVAAERVVVTDSMKWDTASLADDAPGSAELALSLGIDRSRPLVVAGSTAEGEEALVARSCPEGAQVLCAPRKPERFDRAARDLPGCVRRSARKDVARGEPSPSGRYLLDTLGELRAAYALADVVVVGRSFVKLGGSDPIEPVGLGRATVIGPWHRNFDAIVTALREAGAIEVVEESGLGAMVRALLADPARRAEMALRGRGCIERRRGATARHAEMLRGLVAGAKRWGERG